LLPETSLNQLRSSKHRLFLTMLRAINACGYNVCRASDYYSPLPIVSQLEKNMQRWFKPSDLIGIRYDLQAMKDLLATLVFQYTGEYETFPSYKENAKNGYGPGYTAVDAMILYFMVRYIKPRRYIEIGSGLSTYYCSLGAKKNAEIGSTMTLTCIEPYPYKALYDIPHIQILEKELQDIEVSFFGQLESGDILFIDSSHVVKIGGDVPYLYLEVIPRLNKGVILHIHDIPFPYNIPYPPKLWIFGKKWPVFWNETMLLQAFLCYNDAFKILMSTPLLRYFDEAFLQTVLPGYESIDQNPNTFSSIWIEKVR
jgi:predicted O-methyltransferase YrrM